MSKYIEDGIQMGIFKWASMNEKKWPCLKWMHHVRNGGEIAGNALQKKIRGARWKKLGVKRGVADIHLNYPSAGFNGLVMEVKAPGGLLTADQEDYLVYMGSIGYMTCVCYSIESAIAIITSYLGS